jgi:hypothetical protein
LVEGGAALQAPSRAILIPVLNRVRAFCRGGILFISTGWGVEEKYEKYK